MEWLVIVLSVCLMGIFFQDIKYRHVHVIFLILVFVSSFLLIDLSFDLIVKNILYNSFFFLFVFCVLLIYMSLKNKKIISPFKNYFGLGDFILYLAITPLFNNLRNYIIFFIFSMLWA